MSEPGWGQRIRNLIRAYWTPAGKQAFWNLLGLGICTAISQACSFGILLVLTDALAPAAFGAIVFALNLQSYLFTIGTFGLGPIVVRELNQQPEKTDETVTAFLSIAGVTSTLCGIIAAVIVAFIPASPDERVMLWCVAAGNVAACLNLNSLYDAAHRQALSAALIVPVDLLILAINICLFQLGLLSVPAYGLLVITRWLLTALVQAWFYHRRVHRFQVKSSLERIRQLLKAGQPLLVAGLLNAIPISGCVLLVRIFTDEQTTAVYGLAFQVVAVELLILSILIRVLQPHINGVHGLVRKFVIQLILVVAGTSLALAAISISFGWVLFQRILRPEYQPAFEVLLVMQLYVFFISAAWISNLYLLRFHKEGWIRAAHAIAAVGFLAAVFLGCRSLNLGFAVAAIASSSLLLLISLRGLGSASINEMVK